MKRFLLGLFVAISLSVYGATVLWPNGTWLETFQNGFLFGNGSIFSALNSVPTFDNRRLDDRSRKIFFQEDYEGASVSFTCGTNLTAADETTDEIAGTTSLSITQGATPPTVGVECEGPTITLDAKQQDKNLIEVCFNSTWSGNDNEMQFNVYDNTAAADILNLPITASTEPKEHCGYFQTSGTASIDYDIEVLVQNASDELIIDDIEYRVDPLIPTNLYASSEWESYTPTFQGLGTPTSIDFKYKRVGSSIKIIGSLVTGTTTANEAQISLPTGLTLSSTFSGSKACGTYYRATSSVRQTSILCTGGDSFFNFGITDGTRDVTKIYNGNELFGSSETVYFEAEFPIAGWRDTAQGVVVKGQDPVEYEHYVASFQSNFWDSTGTNEDNLDISLIPLTDSKLLEWNDTTQTRLVAKRDIVLDIAVTAEPTVGNTIRIVKSDGNGTTYEYASSTPATVNESLVLDAGDYIYFILTNGNNRNGGISLTARPKALTQTVTVPVDTLTGNSCILQDNDAFVITADTEPIDYNGNCNGWTGGSDGETISPATGNYYTVQKNNSEIRISLAFALGVADTNSPEGVDVYINGTAYRRFAVDYTNGEGSSVYSGSIVLPRGSTSQGDTIAFASFRTVTLGSSTQSHYLHIVEEYGDRGIFLGNMSSAVNTTPNQRNIVTCSFKISANTTPVISDHYGSCIDSCTRVGSDFTCDFNSGYWDGVPNCTGIVNEANKGSTLDMEKLNNAELDYQTYRYVATGGEAQNTAWVCHGIKAQ